MPEPGDKILVKATIEAIHGHDLLVNVAGHNLQISDQHCVLIASPPIPADA